MTDVKRKSVWNVKKLKVGLKPLVLLLIVKVG